MKRNRTTEGAPLQPEVIPPVHVLVCPASSASSNRQTDSAAARASEDNFSDLQKDVTRAIPIANSDDVAVPNNNESTNEGYYMTDDVHVLNDSINRSILIN